MTKSSWNSSRTTALATMSTRAASLMSKVIITSTSSPTVRTSSLIRIGMKGMRSQAITMALSFQTDRKSWILRNQYLLVKSHCKAPLLKQCHQSWRISPRSRTPQPSSSSPTTTTMVLRTTHHHPRRTYLLRRRPTPAFSRRLWFNNLREAVKLLRLQRRE